MTVPDVPWTVVVHHNGQPITGHLPINAWETAGLLAPIIARIIPGGVSVMHAAIEADKALRPPDPQLTIDDIDDEVA